MTTIVSFINLKGGVGKTTVTVNIAATLAKKNNKRVLVVDLDPQTNATVSLITQEEWQFANDVEEQTLYHMFYELLKGTQGFDINKAIIRGVSDIPNLDLLPSSLQLVEIQDDIPDMDNKAYVSHVDVLGNHLEPVLDDYDYVLIDCPPNLGAITLNGISISDYYIVPTVPDILSKIGINLILNRVDNFRAKKKTCKIELAGIVFTKIDNRTNLHHSTMVELRGGDLSSYIFTNELPQRIAIAEAPIDSKPFIVSPTAKRRQDWSTVQSLFDGITKEFVRRVQ